MSNYRVRQVLALGSMPDRQLRLLVALATFMNDDSRSVKAGFGELIRCTGRSHNTVQAARSELESAGRLTSIPGRGRGVLTLWTVLCLPEKGTNNVGTFSAAGKGTNQAPEKVPTEGRKRYQAKPADQPEPERGLNLLAKDSLSAQLGGMLAAEVHGATEREISQVVDRAKGKDNPVAWLRALIANGDARANVLQAREQLADADRRADRRRQLAELDPLPSHDPASQAERADPAQVAVLLDQLGLRPPASAVASGNHAERPATTSKVSDQQADVDRELLEDLAPEDYQRLLAAAHQQLGDVPTLDLLHAAAELARQAAQ